jgi:hypothetical protein
MDSLERVTALSENAEQLQKFLIERAEEYYRDTPRGRVTALNGFFCDNAPAIRRACTDLSVKIGSREGLQMLWTPQNVRATDDDEDVEADEVGGDGEQAGSGGKPRMVRVESQSCYTIGCVSHAIGFSNVKSMAVMLCPIVNPDGVTALQAEGDAELGDEAATLEDTNWRTEDARAVNTAVWPVKDAQTVLDPVEVPLNDEIFVREDDGLAFQIDEVLRPRIPQERADSIRSELQAHAASLNAKRRAGATQRVTPLRTVATAIKPSAEGDDEDVTAGAPLPNIGREALAIVGRNAPKAVFAALHQLMKLLSRSTKYGKMLRLVALREPKYSHLKGWHPGTSNDTRAGWMSCITEGLKKLSVVPLERQLVFDHEFAEGHADCLPIIRELRAGLAQLGLDTVERYDQFHQFLKASVTFKIESIAPAIIKLQCPPFPAMGPLAYAMITESMNQTLAWGELDPTREFVRAGAMAYAKSMKTFLHGLGEAFGGISGTAALNPLVRELFASMNREGNVVLPEIVNWEVRRVELLENLSLLVRKVMTKDGAPEEVRDERADEDVLRRGSITRAQRELAMLIRCDGFPFRADDLEVQSDEVIARFHASRLSLLQVVASRHKRGGFLRMSTWLTEYDACLRTGLSCLWTALTAFQGPVSSAVLERDFSLLSVMLRACRSGKILTETGDAQLWVMINPDQAFTAICEELVVRLPKIADPLRGRVSALHAARLAQGTGSVPLPGANSAEGSQEDEELEAVVTDAGLKLGATATDTLSVVLAQHLQIEFDVAHDFALVMNQLPRDVVAAVNKIPCAILREVACRAARLQEAPAEKATSYLRQVLEKVQDAARIDQFSGDVSTDWQVVWRDILDSEPCMAGPYDPVCSSWAP